ncbi:Dolichyl-phosphate-mannose-protein mannosyltransferase-domain-containing protein [Dichotomocladium elegans]|nr:Dolichyl-phosphate-mannose-protein mannosyltransferase-domain-containing protein [Dichotomocladium elegans]
MDNLKRRHITQQHHGGIEAGYDPIDLNDEEDFCLAKEKIHHYHHRPPSPRLGIYDQRIIQWAAQKRVAIPFILTLLAFWTRFRDLSRSQSVVWDEAHFGKFGSYYLKHEFYFDVHPPLGKMLNGLAGWLSGYDGSFEFKSGSTYPEDMNFWGMRLFNAVWGALMIPVAYATARQFDMSMWASTLAATMVLCDTAYLCISRFILLDSMLLFFTCTTLYCLSGLRRVRDQPFSKRWWTWMIAMGVSLGCVLSVKWVGLFAIALVGVYTLQELWDLFGDVQLPVRVYIAHWLARSVTLIAIPLSIYAASFAAHFAILYKSGPGDPQMSSLFQAQLEGNKFSENPLEIAYGSQVTIKNQGFGSGLLHSHIQTYPEGSRQQQITIYHHADTNNDWLIHGLDIDEQAEPRFVQDGDTVRLFHKLTKKYLYSQQIPGPITTNHLEVSARRSDNDTLSGSHWTIELVDDDASNGDPKRIRALSSRFRLRHNELGCLLRSEAVQLPQWGFKQGEITCDPESKSTDPRNWWNVEEHRNEKLPPAGKNAYRTKFWRDFVHLNVVMWRSNNGLIPDPDKDDKLTSAPTQWPLVSVGLRMCGWSEKHIKFFLLGNPLVWWPSFASILAFGLMMAVYNIRMRRHGYQLPPDQMNYFVSVGGTLTLGWFFHYLPFFMMGRVTYLHHYFPALYFSILMVPFLLDHFTAHHSSKQRAIVFGVALTAVGAAFVFFSPIAFGMTGPVENYASRMWFRSWKLVDSRE